MRVLLLTPPMTQINTPYPATAYLTGFLRQQGYVTSQADPGLSLLLAIFSRTGLTAVRGELSEKFGQDTRIKPRAVRHFLYCAEAYVQSIDSVIGFLQGKNPTLAHRICQTQFLPRGPRFQALDEDPDQSLVHWAFGALGLVDRAQHLASLYIDDLADVIREGIDPRFELSRYAEKLAASAPSFDPLEEALRAPPTLVDRFLDEITATLVATHRPDVVGISAPFPGNIYAGFRMAKRIKMLRPETKIILGGGYVNTELRNLSEPRVFDYVDYVTLDDGERPLLCLLENLQQTLSGNAVYLRTFLRENGQVVFKNDSRVKDFRTENTGTPTYDGLSLDRYLSLCEMLNPMHRLWSDGRWNKLTLAHGCYWKKCSFCDISLDYIGRYEAQSIDLTVSRIEKLIAETGNSGFHFVDEAAPPKVLAALARKLIERKIQITWWGNIRFEKTFTPELTELLAASGCVAVSGGLEVASDRLLSLMKKGVTVEQVARVTHAFSESGVMVHAYLMYGFPTQTVGETIDSLERVRQLFAEGCIQSGFWHRFSATVHSPIGKDPQSFGIELLPTKTTFAENDLPFHDPTGVDHDSLYPGLKKALYNYMHGIGVDQDVRQWFDIPVPKPKVSKMLVQSALRLRSGRG
jgi:radical SAM superfamily enzyme YgiQ (UPF0313 family)